MISKVHVRKLLQINRLQKSLYGRLAVDGALAPKAACQPHADETYPCADEPAIAKLLHYELRLACCAVFGFSSSETDEEHEERNDKAVVKTGFHIESLADAD